MAHLQVAEHRRIHFERHVAGRAGVALSHGWGVGCRVWDNTATRLLDAGRSVLAYDHRCCGASDRDEDAERHHSALLDFLGGIGL